MRTLIKNGTIIIDGKRRIDNGAILVEGDRIIGVYKNYQNIKYDQAIDAKGQYIIPGLLDTHTHGVMGYDFNTCQKEDLEKIQSALLQEGVTAFMASLTCENHERMLELLDMYEESHVENLIGVHIEGPFLNLNKKGVMKEEDIQKPQPDKFYEYLNHCHKITSMTIAPELPGSLDIIQRGNDCGIVMNVGHSDASSSQVIEAQQHGAKGITHLYNAMSQHLHREPGVVTGAIISQLMCELIVDGFHIHPDIIKATYQMIGSDRLVLITDSNPCKGLPDGEYTFSGKNVQIIDGKARVKETGRIAGSTIAMNKECYLMMKYTNCTIDDVVKMACYNPAKLYGLKKGQVAVGYDADILIVNEQFDISTIMSLGQIIEKENL